MGKRLDDIRPGDVFGRWEVLHEANMRSGYRRYWLCRCCCEKGTEREVWGAALKNSSSRSCGCLTRDTTWERNLKHGMSKSATYNIWCGMIARCRNPDVVNYIDYGGRGISVCERWHDFRNFLADMGGRPSSLHSIEREDVNGDYDPDNCVWATRREQNRNKRNTLFLTAGGKTEKVVQWADEVGLTPKAIKLRLKAGWTPEQAVNLADPPNEVRLFTYGNRTLTIAEWAHVIKVTPQTLGHRILRGWPIGAALGFEAPPPRKRTDAEIASDAVPGARYGEWTVLKELPRSKGMRQWLCQCSCGRTKAVQPHNLKRGLSRKCGSCARRGNKNRKRRI